MTAIANVLSRAFPASSTGFDVKEIALICCAGLFISLLVASGGVNLGAVFSGM